MTTTTTIPSFHSSRMSALNMAPLSREDEIRRKIVKLKKEGKIRGDSSSSVDDSSYEDKVKEKLGSKKSKLLGYGTGESGDVDEDDEIRRIQSELDSTDDDEKLVFEDENKDKEEAQVSNQRQGRLGTLPELQNRNDERNFENEPVEVPVSETRTTEMAFSTATPSEAKKPIIDPSLFEDDSSDAPKMSEEELVELVAERLAAKRKREEEAAAKASKELREKNAAATTAGRETQQKTTTGVGGTWIQDEDSKNSTEYYKPKSGSWGAFPRPKDISKAYGGGRRVGAGFSKEDETVSDMKTKKLLKDYRRKVGIDVPTEKEHAAEIEEALSIGQLAMQRGVYATAVSALEKVTKWCSTNSPVGSKVFLELAMAYEAVGRTQEAYKVYQTLSKCRMEDVKYNAKRLLYGLEAIELMRDVSPDFSRQEVKNTFIDTTGLKDIAKNFDDIYNTAYIDLDKGYYKQLTQSVVRSYREARQTLLQATGKDEVGRLKVVQALRSMARYFDDALESEIEAKVQAEPTAYLDGKPLLVQTVKKTNEVLSLDEFVLASSEQMMKNLQGKWRLQLLADKQGDGVSYFNTTTAIQEFSVADMSFSASGPSGLVKATSCGDIDMQDEKRILVRSNIQSSGGSTGFFSIFSGGKNSGFVGAVSRQQQIMSVDSVLLITKSPPGSRKGKDAEKEHFGVWRKIVDVAP